MDILYTVELLEEQVNTTTKIKDDQNSDCLLYFEQPPHTTSGLLKKKNLYFIFSPLKIAHLQLTVSNSLKKIISLQSQAWWHMPAILSLGRLRQEEHSKIEAILTCTVRSCLQKPKRQHKNNNKKNPRTKTPQIQVCQLNL